MDEDSDGGRRLDDEITQRFLTVQSRDLFPGHGRFELPMVKQPREMRIPDRLHQFQIKGHGPGDALHFYIDDYRFESVWTKPVSTYDKYIASSEFVLTPDFSTYANWPRALKIWNVYRNRWCGALWAHYGHAVIPCVAATDEESFEYAFDGIERGSVVSFSSRTWKARPETIPGLVSAYKALVEIVDPSMVLVYGSLPQEAHGLSMFREYQGRWDTIVDRERSLDAEIRKAKEDGYR